MQVERNIRVSFLERQKIILEFVDISSAKCRDSNTAAMSGISSYLVIVNYNSTFYDKYNSHNNRKHCFFRRFGLFVNHHQE